VGLAANCDCSASCAQVVSVGFKHVVCKVVGFLRDFVCGSGNGSLSHA